MSTAGTVPTEPQTIPTSNPTTRLAATVTTITMESDMTATTVPATPVIDTTTSSASPTPTVQAGGRAAATSDQATGVRFHRLASAEWLKFRSVRSNLYALGGAAAAAVGLGALFSSLSGSDEGPGRLADDVLSLSLGGFDLAVMIVGILGVSLVATEYSTGLIRTWFAATTNRLGVLAAKVSVFSILTFVATTIAAALAFVVGSAVFPGGSELTLTDGAVIEAVFGMGFYAACVAAMGVALGFVLRSTAAGAGVVVTTLMMAPVLVSLLPDWIADPVGQVLPSNAASAITGLGTSFSDTLSATGGFIALMAWVVVSVGAAAITLHRRDA